MGYNRQQKKMKKIFLSITLVALSAITMSFMVKPTSNGIDWKARTTESLYNSEYEISLTLYSNGYVAIKSAAGPEGGSYEIDSDNNIVFNWEQGGTEKGFVTTVQTTNGKRIKTVVAHGITFTNTERFVLPRR